LRAYEVNFDGLVGPTHNYGGLARGNLASQRNIHTVSSPKAAAKQGLSKMKRLHDLGVRQAVLPPHDRPAVDVLRRIGFAGSDEDVLRSAQRREPQLLAACSSASSMWAANAATVCPSVDSGDGKAHFTPANLRSNFHRAIEPVFTARVLKAVFPDPERFVHHAPLPGVELFGDEGAANHTRFCSKHGEPGVHVFVYGKSVLETGRLPARNPARQTLEASRAVSRLHCLNASRVVFAQQSPSAIDRGVFHNDVISLGNQDVFFFHEHAFVDGERVKREIRSKSQAVMDLIEVRAAEVSLEESVESYLFNSQLVTLPTGKMALIVPEECRDSARIWGYLLKLADEHDVIERLEVIDVRQSMKNGGGPACLRLRVVLTEEELEHVSRAVLFDDVLFERLNAWVDRHYRDRLCDADLADPRLLEESRAALDELTQILALGSIYPFQG
jgi:succinylarginine dihydrolase